MSEAVPSVAGRSPLGNLMEGSPHTTADGGDAVRRDSATLSEHPIGQRNEDPPTAVSSPSLASRVRTGVTIGATSPGRTGAMLAADNNNSINTTYTPQQQQPTPSSSERPSRAGRSPSSGSAGWSGSGAERVTFTFPAEGITRSVLLGATLADTWRAISLLSPLLARCAASVGAISPTGGERGAAVACRLVATSAGDDVVNVDTESDFAAVRPSLARGSLVLQASVRDAPREEDLHVPLAPSLVALHTTPQKGARRPSTLGTPPTKGSSAADAAALRFAEPPAKAVRFAESDAAASSGGGLPLTAAPPQALQVPVGAEGALPLTPLPHPSIDGANMTTPNILVTPDSPHNAQSHDEARQSAGPTDAQRLAEAARGLNSRLKAVRSHVDAGGERGLYADVNVASSTSDPIASLNTLSPSLLNSSAAPAAFLSADEPRTAPMAVRSPMASSALSPTVGATTGVFSPSPSPPSPNPMRAAKAPAMPHFNAASAAATAAAAANLRSAMAARSAAIAADRTAARVGEGAVSLREEAEGDPHRIDEGDEDGPEGQHGFSVDHTRGTGFGGGESAAYAHAKEDVGAAHFVAGDGFGCGGGAFFGSDPQRAGADRRPTAAYTLAPSPIGDAIDGKDVGYPLEEGIGMSPVAAEKANPTGPFEEPVRVPPVRKYIPSVDPTPPPRYARIRFCFTNENLDFRPNSARGWLMSWLRGEGDAVYFAPASEAVEVGSGAEKKPSDGRRSKAKRPVLWGLPLAHDAGAPTAYSFDPVDPKERRDAVAKAHPEGAGAGDIANYNPNGPYYAISTVDSRTGQRSYLCWANNRFEARPSWDPFGVFVIEPYEYPREAWQQQHRAVLGPRRRSLGLAVNGGGLVAGGAQAPGQQRQGQRPTEAQSQQQPPQHFTIRSVKGYLCKGAQRGIVHSVEPNSLSVIALDLA